MRRLFGGVEVPMAYKRKLEKDIRCPLEYGLDVFGGKWKSRILCVLSDGPLRYSVLRDEMADVADAALARCRRCDYVRPV